MTDDKLREASERVAKAWLDADLLSNGWFGSSSLRILPCDLCGPYGMDLLLDAVEEKKNPFFSIQYHSYFDFKQSDRQHSFNIYKVQWTYDILKERVTHEHYQIVGKAQNENRYAALIFALDKASEAINENS